MDASLITGRRALFQVHSALEAHASALILVGAQAIQEWAGAGDAEIGGSPGSKDADVQVDVAAYGSDPTLERAMLAAGFVLSKNPGTWLSVEGTQVDLLVAETQAKGSGRRSAGLDVRDPKSARRVSGLEACLFLNEVRELGMLGEGERPRIRMRVARPAAILVAKAHKIAERVVDGGDRPKPKDALDVLRLLSLGTRQDLTGDFRRILVDPRCAEVASRGRDQLRDLFGRPRASGCELLRRGYADQGETHAARVHVLLLDLLADLGAGRSS